MEKTKVVVRRLPPLLPEHIFLQSIEPWRQHTDWSQYVPGKQSKYALQKRLD
jgi:hypothetical protein